MPNMEELISKISAKITKSEGEICMLKIDLDYAYGQAKLYKEAAKYCVFSIIGGDFTGHYRFKKGFYGLSDIPTVFQKHIDAVLEFKTPVCLDDVFCVTNGNIEDHEKEVREVLTKLQNAGYRVSERKTEFFKNELTWLGYHNNRDGVEPIKDKTEAITKLEVFTFFGASKELKSFLGSIQHLLKFINNLAKKTDRMRKLLKKDIKWDWTSEIDEDFEELKKEITEAPCLAHFDPNKDNYITTDACNTGLGATLWQKEAQPTELQVVTIKDAEGELADYLVLNDTRKRGRSTSRRTDEEEESSIDATNAEISAAANSAKPTNAPRR